MPLISLSFDEVRRAASKVKDISGGLRAVPLLRVAGQVDLSLAVAEFVGCMNDCRSERERDVDVLSAGLREVADMFENWESSVIDEIRALEALVPEVLR